MTDVIETVVEILVKVDRRVGIREIEERLDISRGTVHRILNRMGLSKVFVRWMPLLLTGEDRARRVDCSRNFLQRYSRESENETIINL